MGKLFQQHKNQLDGKTEEKICRNKRNSRRMTAVLASPARFERATFRLGVAPIRHREVTSNAKKCLEIQGFSAFQILSDTTL